MKKVWLIIAILGFQTALHGAEADVSGTVTYLSSGTVYTSLGSDEGVRDSTLLFVISGHDTTATLRVFAVSSRSSACRVVESQREPEVGNLVVGRRTIEDTPALPPAAGIGSTQLSAETNPPAYRPKMISTPEPFSVNGRLSAQYYGTIHEQPDFNVAQPGLVTKLNVRSNEIPVSLDLYANFRTLSTGNEGPFSEGARNQSRLHRLVLEYDDEGYAVSLGRFAPSSIASIGYVDGLMASTAIGRFSIGILGGFQPAASQRGMSTEYKKIGVFGSYFPSDGGSSRITAAYARTYRESELDREAASLSASLLLTSDLSLYLHSDFDLRKFSDGSFTYSPTLTQAFVNARYRIVRAIAVGVSANATRPVYRYTALQTIPQDLVDTDLRAGVGLSLYLYLPAGITFTNTYTPRTSSSKFADNYTEYAALTFANIASSGFTVRTNFTMNGTDYNSSRGYGVNLSRNMWQIFDLMLRFQQYDATIKQIGQTSRSSTIGLDLMIPVSRMFSVMGIFERYRSPGWTTSTVFAEISYRF